MGSAEIHPANNAVTACKMWAIFAIGQLYSTKSVTQNATFPGLAYFAKASSMLQVISERPHLDVVETMLLLVSFLRLETSEFLTRKQSLYSLELNRRHSAYTLAGSAIRVATVMGLHVNADSHIQDPEVREHRNRVWWTSYTFDRMWSSKIGLPNAVPDEDILVDFPSPVAGDAAEDFVDHEYLIAGVKLARLSGDIITSIYGRRKQRGLFSHRVQNALKELRRWTEDLPRHLQVNTDQPAKTVGRPVSLHLLFNQVRPVTKAHSTNLN